MEYKNLQEIAEAIYHHTEIDYNAVRDFFSRTHIHPDTLIIHPWDPQRSSPSTLMVLACREENVEMAKTLLELGSDPHYGYDDCTVAPYCELLYPEGSDWDYVHTPKLEILKLFLAYGFDVDKLTNDGEPESFYDYLQYSVYENHNPYHSEILPIVEPYHKEYDL